MAENKPFAPGDLVVVPIMPGVPRCIAEIKTIYSGPPHITQRTNGPVPWATLTVFTPNGITEADIQTAALQLFDIDLGVDALWAGIVREGIDKQK